MPNHTRRIPPTLEPHPPSMLHGPLSRDGRMTPNGRFMVFSSYADNLPGQNGKYQIYRFEQGTSTSAGILIHVSKNSAGVSASADCERPSISNDGTKIVFDTAAALRSDDLDTKKDVYLYNLTNPNSPVITRITRPRGAGGFRGDSYGASIAGAGQFVAYTSDATDWVVVGGQGDLNGTILDVFRYDVVNDAIELASLNNDPPTSMTRQSTKPFSTVGDELPQCPGTQVPDLRVGRVISDDGDLVLMCGTPCDWTTDPTTPFLLCPEIANSCNNCTGNCTTCSTFQQVYVRDLVAGVTTMVSRQAVPTPLGCDGFFPGNACSRRPSISGDRSRIAFSSLATNFRTTGFDTDTVEDVFFGNTTDVFGGVCVNPTRVSVIACTDPMKLHSHSFQPVLSTNGQRIGFASDSARLLSGCPDLNPPTGKRDVFIRDVPTAITRRFSVSSAGTAGNDDSMNPDVSGDGKIALYESKATNLLGPSGDMNGQQDIFQSPSPQGPFIRGDSTGDAQINISDSILIFNWLFQGGQPPPCYDAADFNDNGTIEQADGNAINMFLFQGGPPPACPFSCTATTSCCGKDPTGDGLPCGQVLAGCTQFAADGSCSNCP